jgi:hypothetical protein
MKRTLAILFALNAAYLVVLPSIAARVVSALGCLTAVVLVIGRRSRHPARGGRLEPDHTSKLGVLPVAAFALPIVGYVAQPHLAFWHVDFRALLIVAWLIAIARMIAAAPREPCVEPDPPPARQPLVFLTTVVVVWSSLFWLMLIWDIGIRDVVLTSLRDDRLSWTFQIWETRRPSSHLFLGWLTHQTYARREAYTNHLHPYLFSAYAFIKMVQLSTGLPFNVGRNMLPFAIATIGAAAFLALLVRCPYTARSRGWKFYLSLFAALGFVLSEGHYWTYLYTNNSDSIFPIVVYLSAIVWAAAEPRVTDSNRRALTIAAVLFGLFGWLYTPLVIGALWASFGRSGSSLREVVERNRTLVRVSIICGGVGAVTYALPRILVAVKGYTVSDSPFIFRSGLDGDTRYFHDVVQAVFRPYWGNARSWTDFLFPAFIPLLFALPFIIVRRRSARYLLLSQLVFLVSPYFFSLALFPQSVSIHPYLYDQLLFLPVALTGAMYALTSPVQQRLRGPCVLIAALLALATIMANFIQIAQMVRKIVPASLS